MLGTIRPWKEEAQTDCHGSWASNLQLDHAHTHTHTHRRTHTRWCFYYLCWARQTGYLQVRALRAFRCVHVFHTWLFYRSFLVFNLLLVCVQQSRPPPSLPSASELENVVTKSRADIELERLNRMLMTSARVIADARRESTDFFTTPSSASIQELRKFTSSVVDFFVIYVRHTIHLFVCLYVRSFCQLFIHWLIADHIHSKCYQLWRRRKRNCDCLKLRLKCFFLCGHSSVFVLNLCVQLAVFFVQ